MPPRRETPLIGISDFGKRVGGLKVSMGTTEPAGFEVWAELNRYNIVSGYTGAVRQSKPQTVVGHCMVRLQDVDLANYNDLMGQPASQHTGDLGAATPTKETVKVLADMIGTEEFELYCEGPGPEGPREVKVYRAVVETPPREKMGRDGHKVYETQFLILETAGRELWDIDDNP